MKSCEHPCEVEVVSYASVITDPHTMTRKRMSDEIIYPMAVEEAEMQDNSQNKLPKFEYVTQISSGSDAMGGGLHQYYCETVDFHNEKGQRIFLTDSENAEFVNIMLQENLLSVQTPMSSASTATPTTTTVNGVGGAVQLLELNSAELLDLDGRKEREINGIVTFVNNNSTACDEVDFEKQLVRVDHDPTTTTPTLVRGQTINICTARREQNNNHHQQGNEDLEDKNLSWLFNFKLDELPHLSPEVSHRTILSAGPSTSSSSASTGNGGAYRSSNSNQKNQDKLNAAAAAAAAQESESSAREPEKVQKKPPFTYTELIEYALEDQSELTVSGIYQWISDRFPYYKSNDDRWKNSVRHNLSINPHFRKGKKAPQGAGHLWTIASRDSEANNLAWEHKKQRLELFFKMEAAANLAYESERSRMSVQQTTEQDEIRTATASIMLPEAEENHQHQHHHHGTSYGQENLITSHYFSQTDQDSQQIIYDTVDGSDDLCRVATEILNGVRRNVEVQIIHPTVGFDTVIDTCYSTADYLNPIPKDEIMQESGLRSSQRNDIGQDFFVTEEIDPVELGINMTTNGEDEVFFSDDFSHYFGLGSNIVA